MNILYHLKSITIKLWLEKFQMDVWSIRDFWKTYTMYSKIIK